MEIPNRPVNLAEFLEISLEALRKQMKRMGLVEGRFNRHAEMDKSAIKAVLQVYGHKEEADSLSISIETDKLATGQKDSLTSGSRKVVKTDNSTNRQSPIEKGKRTTTTTDKLLAGQTDNLPIETDKYVDNLTEVITGQTDSLPPPATTDYTELSKDLLLALIAMVSMYVQMCHTAQVVGGEWLQAWAYALSIQFTGLAMTLYKGKLGYLKAFAVAEFAINLLHYRPWGHCELIEGVSVCGGFEEWTRSILLSALIAFTIYSYVEIFAARRNEKTDTL